MGKAKKKRGPGLTTDLPQDGGLAGGEEAAPSVLPGESPDIGQAGLLH